MRGHHLVTVISGVVGVFVLSATEPACSYDYTIGSGAPSSSGTSGPQPGDSGNPTAACNGQSCECKSLGATCNLGCDNGSCITSCALGTSCDVKCGGGGCVSTCQTGAKCTYACKKGGCTFTCVIGSECDIDCEGGGCKSTCPTGATCKVKCAGGGCSCEGAGCP